MLGLLYGGVYMSDIQDKWNDYYADKKWVDTKGWCHLDGTPYSFKELEKQADYRTSLIKTILKTILYQFLLTVFAVFCLTIFYENTHAFIELIYVLSFYFMTIRCAWTIIKNLFKRNLKLW